MTRLLALLLLTSVAVQSAQYDIPSSRTATWTPGVTVGVIGGIPTNRNTLINVTLSPYFADNTGATDASGAINAAIAAAGTNEVVYLPAGTYKLTSGLGAPLYKSNWTLRGAGMGVTILDCRVARAISLGYSVDWTDTTYNPNTTITSGLTAGSTSVVVVSTTNPATAHPIIANYQARITLPDDPAIPVVSVYGYTGLRTISVYVTSVVGNTVSFTPPIPATPGVTAGAAFMQAQLYTPEGIGIEDMTIDGANASTMSDAVYVDGPLHNSWIKGVKVTNHDTHGFFFSAGNNIEVRRCYIGASIGAPGTSNHAGIIPQDVTGGLFEDNIITGNFPGFEVNYGTTGSVFAFNYIRLANKGIDTNHAPFPSFNLYEGNVTPTVQCDGYFGGAYADTLFRNWIQAYDYGAVTYAISLCRFTRNYNIVGNIIQSPVYPYTQDGVSMGNPNLGNSSYIGTAEPSTGDYWLDFDSSTGRSKVWTGTLTTRASNTAGTITLGTGQGVSFAAHLAGNTDRAAGGSVGNFAYFGTVVGDVVSYTGASGTQPIAGSAMTLYPSPLGYQELDLDVANTTLRKGNYYFFSSSIPAGESLAGQTLANSLFRGSKPADWGSLTWPAFNAASPGTPAITQIPAGYFYTYGSWPNTTPGAPTITLNPVTQTATAGASVSFTAAATGSPTPTWQWYKNSAPITGATNALLFLASVTSSNNGSYYAVATNSEGSAQTTTATLTVGSAGAAPAITLNPTSRSVVAGASTTFTANASGNPTPTWQWYFNGALMPGKTQSSLTLNPVAAGNAGAYYARASNSVGTAQSASATLAVTSSPETPLKAPTITSVK